MRTILIAVALLSGPVMADLQADLDAEPSLKAAVVVQNEQTTQIHVVSDPLYVYDLTGDFQGRRHGFAMYLCEVANQYGTTYTNVTVTILDGYDSMDVITHMTCAD